MEIKDTITDNDQNPFPDSSTLSLAPDNFRAQKSATNPYYLEPSISLTVPRPSSSQSNRSSASNSSRKQKGGDPHTRESADEQLRSSLQSSIVSGKMDIKWEDVAGLDAAKEELQEAVVLPIKFPELFRGKRKPRRSMLLYGPPGTGKSYLAKGA